MIPTLRSAHGTPRPVARGRGRRPLHARTGARRMVRTTRRRRCGRVARPRRRDRARGHRDALRQRSGTDRGQRRIRGREHHEDPGGGHCCPTRRRRRAPGADYGLGLGIYNSSAGIAYGHNGRIVGYHASIRHDPERKATAIVLSNDGNAPTEHLVSTLLTGLDG